MKKWFLVGLVVLGCDRPSVGEIEPAKTCQDLSFFCLGPSVMVFKSEDGLKVRGTLAEVSLVSVNLAVDGRFHSREFKGQKTIDVVKQFNFAFPKEKPADAANLVVSGFITVYFANTDGNVEIRQFAIEDHSLIRDRSYPEVTYESSTPLTLDWLNAQ